MDDVTENHISRDYKVKFLMDDKGPEIAVEVPIITDHIQTLNDGLVNLSKLGQLASDQIGGFFIHKDRLQELATDDVIKLVNANKGYYTTIKDDVMLGRVNYSRSDLIEMRDIPFIYATERIITINTPFNPNLIPYGSSLAKLGTATQAVADYVGFVQGPRSAIAAGSAFLSNALKQVDLNGATIKEMAMAMEAVKDSMPVIYDTFRNSIRIDDTGAALQPGFIVTVQPNSFLSALVIPYLAKRYFRIKNVGPGVLTWGLSTTDGAFSNLPSLLEAGAISHKLSSTLGPNGDILLFQNVSAFPLIVEVTVIG